MHGHGMVCHAMKANMYKHIWIVDAWLPNRKICSQRYIDRRVSWHVCMCMCMCLHINTYIYNTIQYNII